MNITIDLPVYPYIKSYIEKKVNNNRVIVSRHERIGKLIYLSLEKAPIHEKMEYKDLGSTIPLIIKPDIYRRKGVYLSVTSVQVINDYFKNEIYDEIFNYLDNIVDNIGIKAHKNIKVPADFSPSGKPTEYKTIQRPDLFYLVEQKNAIADILQKYNISEENLTLDAIKKAYQRYRQSM